MKKLQERWLSVRVAGGRDEKQKRKGATQMMIENRLAKLEKQNRWLRGAVCCLCAWCGLSVFLGAQTEVHEVVRSKTFSLVDNDGRTRGIWSVTDKGECKMVLSGDVDKKSASIVFTAKKDESFLEANFSNKSRWIAAAFDDSGEMMVHRGGELKPVKIDD